MSFSSFLRDQLEQLKRSGQFRDPESQDRERATEAAGTLRKPLLNACSNDYLGLCESEAAAATASLGAGASRLVHGTHRAHELLERGVAHWQQADAALVFSSGYAANVGTISALATRDDLIVSDQLNHASIIDGCRLSRATVRVYPHLDLQAARTALEGADFRRKWLVTESYFSMDGDSPELPKLAEIAGLAGAALIVDEAHALGVFGPSGRGLCALNRVTPEVLVGGFGKALNAQGGFVAGSDDLRTWLWNRARSFMYSTAMSPALAGAALERVRRVAAADGAREALERLCRQVASLIPREFMPFGRHGPIVPLLCGSEQAARAVAEAFLERGILVQPIGPPTVAPGQHRVRLTLRSTLQLDELSEAVRAAVQILQERRH